MLSNVFFLAAPQDEEGCVKEVEECLQWVKTVADKAEIAEERVTVLSEVETHYSSVQSLITKVEELLDSATVTSHRAEMESKLQELKHDWQALKMKARKKRRRPGRLGSELESKQVMFACELAGLTSWLTEAKDKAMEMTTASSVQGLQEALTVCAGVRSEFSDQRALYEDLLVKGKELVAELGNENLADKESVEVQMEELKSQWKSLEEDSGKRESVLQDAVEQFQKMESAIGKMQSSLTEVETKLHNITTDNDFYTVESELQSLQELLLDAETYEAGIAAIETCDQVVHVSCKTIQDALNSRVCEMKENLLNVKENISSEIHRDQEILDRRNDLAAELLQCKELINRVEISTGEELKLESLPLLEEDAVQATEDMNSVESALASLHVKSEQLLSSLKPSEQKALEVEINDVKSHWDGTRGSASERVQNLAKRIATRKDFDQDLEAAKGWIEKVNEEISRSEIPSSDISTLEEHVARLKNIHSESKSPENLVNALLTKSEMVLQNADVAEQQIFDSQLADLKNLFDDATERSKVEIDKLEEKIAVQRDFQEAYQKLKSWIENEKRSAETYSAVTDGSSLEMSLEELKSKQRSIDSREREIQELAEKAARITNLDAAGKQNIESQLLSLQMLYTELKSKVAEELESIQGKSDEVKEFEAELRHCRDIVQEIESVVSSDPPSFADVEEMERYVQELKGKFQDAVAQRSAMFQLGEKKDEVPSVKDALENYTEVFDQWKALLARFSEKLAETERRIAEEKELNESVEEVSSWVDNVEKEMELSFESEQAQEVEEVVGQVEKLKALNTECASYGQFVESLRSKVEESPNESSEGHEDRLSSLEARVEAMHKRLAAKLGDVEHCVNDVSDVTERISSCKEWLLQKKELIAANEQGIQFGNVQQLEEKFAEYQTLNQEASTVLHDIMQAKEKVGQGVGKVSSALEESLSKELNSLCDTLMGLHEDSAARSVELEQCLVEAREFEREVARYGALLQEAGDVLRRSRDRPVSLAALAANLGELKDLQNELREKREEFHNFLETNKDLAAQSGLQERLDKVNEDFENLITEIQPLLSKTEVKIKEYMQCSKELEDSLEWLAKAAVVIDPDVAYSLDDTSAEEQLAKLKELRPELESFEAKLSAIAQSREAVSVVGEDGGSDLLEKLDSVRTKWEMLREDARLKELSLVKFVQAKEDYIMCAVKCEHALDDLKKSAQDECVYSAVPEKSTAQLERRRKHQAKCQELEEQIQALKEAGDHVTDTCEELREPLRVRLIKIKDDWQKMNTEALIMQEQLETWISEVGSIREDVELSLGRVKAIHESLQSSKPQASDIQTANYVLGQVKQSASELEEEKGNVQSILEKSEGILAKLDASEKPGLEESFRALQSAFNEAEEESNRTVRQAEERINDIIEFDKESARCESLLTIYQAAAPVDVSCTVETLEDQMAKLKRLYGDMESRESHMTALHEKEVKLSRDDNTQSGRTTPDGKAGKLQGDWGKLKASVGEKLRELERLAQTKKDFEDEYDTCLEGVQELETAIHETGGGGGPVEARVQQMQELCARIKSYRNKLDLLADRCDELPNVAYEQKDLDPRRKLSAVVRRWEEVKDDALGKLNELEKEKAEVQNIALDVSKLQSWVQDICAPFVNKELPSVVQRDDLQKALVDNTDFRSILETKINWVNELLLKTRSIKGNGQHKEILLSNLRDLSRNLEDAQAKLASNGAEIKSRLQQHSAFISGLDRIRDLLVEVKSGQSSEAVDLEGDNWIEESITSQRIELAKLESCDLLLASKTEEIDKVTAGLSEPGETAIERDLRALTSDVHAAQQQLSEEILHLETLRDFDNDCSSMLDLYGTLAAKVRAVDLQAISETANVARTEEELMNCRAVDQNLSDKDGEFEALMEKEGGIVSFAPTDKRHELEARCQQVRESRTTLKELIDDRVEALRSLVAEQQTLEGWLKKAGILVQDAATLLRENEASFTLDVSRMFERSQALAGLITKLEEYQTFSGTFRGSGKAPEVARINAEMIQLKKQLVTDADELQQFKEQFEAFESEAAVAAAIFERCTAEQCTPGSLHEAQEELANVKVNNFNVWL